MKSLTRISCIASALGLLLLAAPPAATAAAHKEANCTTAREFIVTTEYLHDHKDFGMSPDAARKLALEIAGGCTGASLRYMRVVNVLLSGGMGFPDASKIGVEFSARPDSDTATFLTVFEKAFLREYMDLDIRSAISLARSLSVEFNGDSLLVRDDFGALYDYCARSKALDLSPTDCGQFAARVVKANEQFPGRVAEAFVKVFDFLREDSRGPKLGARDAAKLAEEVVKKGPNATDNFVIGYRYAIAKTGLGMGGKDALEFALTLSK